MANRCLVQFLRLLAGKQGSGLHTLACILLLAFLDEQEAGTLRAEGHHHQTQHRWHSIEGEQQGPQVIRACQQVKQIDLHHLQGNP